MTAGSCSPVARAGMQASNRDEQTRENRRSQAEPTGAEAGRARTDLSGRDPPGKECRSAAEKGSATTGRAMIDDTLQFDMAMFKTRKPS